MAEPEADGRASATILFAASRYFSSSIGDSAAQTIAPSFAVLVFSKTTGFRHDSIPDGIAAIRVLGAEHGFRVDDTEAAERLIDPALAS